MKRIVNTAERILLVGGNIWYFGEGMLGPLFAVFAEDIGGDVFDIAWAWATYLIVTGMLMIIFGKLWDRTQNKAQLMVAGYALNALCTFGYLLVQSPTHLLIVQAGLGIAAAMATPTWDALYDKHGSANRMGMLWGISEGTAQIITGIGVIVGGIIVSIFSFPVLFWSMGSVQVVATLYQAQSLRKQNR
ncbi:MAG: MFS transporter [Candidatus Kerfeldbacteria bacterium]|nr:MFS transporter [Candidatus Kerfeldbacteria bacterium]